MKTILIGYPGSRKAREMSAYLFNKYTKGLDPVWLEYEGDTKDWSQFLVDYLTVLDNKEVVFALDDYLISGPMGELPKLGEAVCSKLCFASLEENREYPVTTQYTLWNRKELINILKQTTTPWSFEINGSAMFKQAGKLATYAPIIPYYTNSSLSARWDGIRLDGLSEEDVKEVQAL